MGCGSSSPIWPTSNDEDYVKYKGYGADYLDYEYYGNHYFPDSSQQRAWKNYCDNAPQYQKDSGAGDDGAYKQYRHWYDNQPQKPAKIIKETEPTVNLVIEHSTADIREKEAVQEYDCSVEEDEEEQQVARRMRLKAISTALRITITKHQPPPIQGPNDLNVIVLDTIRELDAGFLTEKPLMEANKGFVDEKFPPSKALGSYVDKYRWCRPQEIYPDKEICLFHEGTSLEDVDQGVFGTCYFLATLAGLATQPNVMKQIILPDAYDIKAGIFHCRFWSIGQWVDIYIDDYLPCDSHGLVGCKSKNYEGEMWVPLIEKAYAKFMWSYPEIEGGTPREAYLALTGGCAEWLALNYYKFDSAAVYQRLANAIRHGAVVVCSSTSADDKLKDYIQEKGILLNHAYTVTATAIVQRDEAIQESLIKLRNPWSHKEWTGPWSDYSPEWYTVNEADRLQLRQIEDNGEFWMSWTEFWSIFTDLTVCSITPDYDSDGMTDGLDNVYCIYGQWKRKQSGGWKDVSNNPTYELSVPSNSISPVYILVESLQRLPPKVHKTTAGNILLKDLAASRMSAEYLGADALTYSTANPLTRRFELSPGGKYHIIPTKYEAGERGNFLLRVFSKHPLKIKPVKRRRE